MSTHVPKFQSFLRFLHHFVLTKLATSSKRVNRTLSILFIFLSVVSFLDIHLVCGDMLTKVLYIRSVSMPFSEHLLADQLQTSGCKCVPVLEWNQVQGFTNLVFAVILVHVELDPVIE